MSTNAEWLIDTCWSVYRLNYSNIMSMWLNKAEYSNMFPKSFLVNLQNLLNNDILKLLTMIFTLVLTFIVISIFNRMYSRFLTSITSHVSFKKLSAIHFKTTNYNTNHRQKSYIVQIKTFAQFVILFINFIKL